MAKVKVAQGWIEGELLDVVTGDGQYYSFKGVPYAAPPVGKLRFKAPQPPLPWNGIKKANTHGPNCPQLDMFTQQLIAGNEDCLFLNIYTRDLNPKTPLPVMVFIHGGAFQCGSGDVAHYGPDFLIDHRVLLVTINYRVEALGFLCLDTEDVPGNAGLKDQVAALRWVKENIKNFGGDQDNITVFGQSAGGASAAYHFISPLSKGLFSKVISMSGVPSCDWAYPFRPRQRAFLLGKLLGIETEDPEELLDFLQSVPVEKLVNVQAAVLHSEELIKGGKLNYFTPVAENDYGHDHFLTKNPFEMLKEGNVNKVDLLIGNASEEALLCADLSQLSALEKCDRYREMLVPTEITFQCSPNTVLEVADKIHKYYFKGNRIGAQTLREYIKYMSASLFVYDIHRFISKVPKIEKSKKFLYVFSCQSDRNFYGKKGADLGIPGASHLDDMMYLFDAKLLQSKIEKNSREYKLIQLVNTVFTNFAKYGTPTPDQSLGITWPEYDNESKKYVDIGDELRIGTNYKAEEFAFWKSIFEFTGVDY